jgi:hypothetical protein
MDTELVEQSGTGQAHSMGPMVGTEMPGGTVEATIDEVDHLLDEVEAALTRLDEGTYGTCGSCGTGIGDSLLSADPTARNCAACEGVEPDELVGGGTLDDVVDSRNDDELDASGSAADPWSANGLSEY